MINLIADKGTHLSEHDGLNTGEKWATLGKGELGIGVADPDLERVVLRAIITDEKCIGYAVPIEIHSRIATRVVMRQSGPEKGASSTS